MLREDMIVGVHIGEHGFDADKVLDELRVRIVERGYNFATIRTFASRRGTIAQHYYTEWAEYLAKNKVYFLFLYTIDNRGGKLATSIDPETVEKMKEIAGEYFLGDMVGELGSCFGAKFAGYGGKAVSRYSIPKQNHDDMAVAARDFIEIVNDYVQINRKIGMPHVSSVEPTAFAKYIAMGGVDIPMLELMCGTPDIMLPFVRGMSRAFGQDFGTYLAHEWYGGFDHLDPLKRKRLSIVTRMAYLSGSRYFCIESGDEMLTAYGASLDADSAPCREYIDALDDLHAFVKANNRDPEGPITRIAFVSGRYDPFVCWGGSSGWGQYDREEWGHSEAEHSWDLLREIGARRPWWDVENYGERDTSALPAYGQYDVLPIEADLDAFKRYDQLIFLGHNSMTDGDLDKLTAYVEAGGRLLMSVAHLNTSTKRTGELILPSAEKIERLFGVRITDEVRRTNAGAKFASSVMPDVKYPATFWDYSDPILSHGYAAYAVVEPTSASVTAKLSDGFARDTFELTPLLTENRLGGGVASLVSAINYPGNPAVYPIYRAIVRELLSASARNCELKVIAPDRLRYSVYPNGSICLLNTDYDLPITVHIERSERSIDCTLAPLEMRMVRV